MHPKKQVLVLLVCRPGYGTELKYGRGHNWLASARTVHMEGATYRRGRAPKQSGSSWTMVAEHSGLS